jgi:hypothetical protein
MKIIDYQPYKPAFSKPHSSSSGTLAMLAASFGLGMASDLSESNVEDKANYPDWWKSIVGYKAGPSVNGSSADLNALVGSSTSYKVSKLLKQLPLRP